MQSRVLASWPIEPRISRACAIEPCPLCVRSCRERESLHAPPSLSHAPFFVHKRETGGGERAGGDAAATHLVLDVRRAGRHLVGNLARTRTPSARRSPWSAPITGHRTLPVGSAPCTRGRGRGWRGRALRATRRSRRTRGRPSLSRAITVKGSILGAAVVPSTESEGCSKGSDRSGDARGRWERGRRAAAARGWAEETSGVSRGAHFIDKPGSWGRRAPPRTRGPEGVTEGARDEEECRATRARPVQPACDGGGCGVRDGWVGDVANCRPRAPRGCARV